MGSQSTLTGGHGDRQLLHHLLLGFMGLCSLWATPKQTHPWGTHTFVWMVTPRFDCVPEGKRRLRTNSPASFLFLHILDDGVFGEGELVLPLCLVVKQGFDCAL